MKLIECGFSVFRKLQGETPKTHNYVCVLPTPKDYTLQQGFNKMKTLLNESKKGGMALTNVEDDLTVKDAVGNTYTLAHSNKVIEGGTLVVKPDTFFKHSYSRLFHYETIYINAEGTITSYIKNAVEGIVNDRSLYTLNNVHPIVYKNNKEKILMQCITFYTQYKLRTDANETDLIYNLNRDSSLIQNKAFVQYFNEHPNEVFTFFYDYGITGVLTKKPFNLQLNIDEKSIIKVK